MRIYQSKKGRAMQHITVQPDKTKNFVRWSRERTPRLIASHDKATNSVEMEQRMDTEAHQRSRLTQLRLAFTNNSRIGAVYDVQYFREADYPENERAHVLPSLYESGRICTHCDAHCWIEERKGFCCESGKVNFEINSVSGTRWEC